jgi:hypothetical protein
METYNLARSRAPSRRCRRGDLRAASSRPGPGARHVAAASARLARLAGKATMLLDLVKPTVELGARVCNIHPPARLGLVDCSTGSANGPATTSTSSSRRFSPRSARARTATARYQIRPQMDQRRRRQTR